MLHLFKHDVTVFAHLGKPTREREIICRENRLTFRESTEFTVLCDVQPTDLFYWISIGWRSKIIFLYTDLYIRFLTDLKYFQKCISLFEIVKVRKRVTFI